MPDAGNCGAYVANKGKAGLLNGVSIVPGHENGRGTNRPDAAVRLVRLLERRGDRLPCAWQGLADLSLSTGKFAVQPEYSNASGSCVLSY
jgi:hypothetical protein